MSGELARADMRRTRALPQIYDEIPSGFGALLLSAVKQRLISWKPLGAALVGTLRDRIICGCRPPQFHPLLRLSTLYGYDHDASLSVCFRDQQSAGGGEIDSG